MSPISVPQSGSPRIKARVPSIGSMNQQYSASVRGRAELLSEDPVRRVGLGKAAADGGFGVPVGLGDRIEKVASFMVNGATCAEMRQNDRSGLVSQSVCSGEKGLEFRLFGIGHGNSLKAVLP